MLKYEKGCDNMQKLVKILFGVVIFAVIIACIFLYSIYYRVEHVKINHKTLSSNKISENLNDITIGYISDIYYNEFMHEQRLESMLNTYEKSSADVCIFGGDLFSKRLLKEISEEDIEKLTTLLKDIEAPLGKFAILGDCDLLDEERQELVTNILMDADFEIISSKPIQIRTSQYSDSLTLVGIDSYLQNTIDTEKITSETGKENFHLLVTHCPDFVSQGILDMSSYDAIIAGHSLGGQIRLPLLGATHYPEGAKQYTHGTYQLNTSNLYVCNGLGTMNIDMRLLAAPEIIVLKLQSQ